MREILLHTCCAPCISYVYELLHKDYNITSYFYNPNIHPQEEYHRRLNELYKFSGMKYLNLIVGEYDNELWLEMVKELSHLGERSERCWVCYRMRLEQTFRHALNNSIDIIATVLSISPYKDAGMLNSIGKELEKKYNIEFLEADFKKNEGYKKSIELSKQYGFYRQKYCGCVYSKIERGL